MVGPISRRRSRPELKIVASRTEPGPPPRRQPTLPPEASDPFAIDMKREERAAHEAEERHDEDRRRLKANLLAAVWIALIVGGAVWLIESARDNARLQECFARGYKNCVKTELPR
jgi:hypothetical protein